MVETDPRSEGEGRRGKAKGVIVRPMVEWFASVFGPGALAELASSVAAPWREELVAERPALGIIPAGWYDERLASALADAVVGAASRAMSEADALRAIGAVTVDRSLGRVSRAALEWFASPETAAISAQMFWRFYHSTGSISASVAGASMHAVGIWGVHGRRWCAIVGASSVRVLELTGCTDVRLERHTCGGGERSCEMTLRWTPR
ncbi:MAG: hypothetical protein KF850_34710 [Labilithrix sp.]|nr:hypothetical protein [Labilithrix sp.]